MTTTLQRLEEEVQMRLAFLQPEVLEHVDHLNTLVEIETAHGVVVLRTFSNDHTRSSVTLRTIRPGETWFARR